MSETIMKTSDKRQCYLKKMLQLHGYEAYIADELSENELERLFTQTHAVPFLLLLPIPVPKELLVCVKKFISPVGIVLGGSLPDDFLKYCQQKQILCIDYLRSEIVALKNAVATAEGIISQAIIESPENLHGNKVLVIGFGKCGEILAEKLAALQAQVYISTRNELAQARAKCYGYAIHTSDYYKEYHMIFNTAPVMVLSHEIIDLLNPDVYIFDIASKPGGTDFSYCEKKGIHAKLYPGIPGKYAPKTSAEIIFHHLQKTFD